jgi:serine/threonine protein kinase
MPLSDGALLGPYEILSALGAGGMGEVYRARDIRLDRIVAIKILLSGVAAGEEVRRRFEREARAVSSLNHPHICALYDIGRQDGVDFLVMTTTGCEKTQRTPRDLLKQENELPRRLRTRPDAGPTRRHRRPLAQ